MMVKLAAYMQIRDVMLLPHPYTITRARSTLLQMYESYICAMIELHVSGSIYETGEVGTSRDRECARAQRAVLAR